jgi:glycosidase
VPETEHQFIADAVNWIDAYGLDGFRVDAVKHVEPNAVYDMRAELARRFEQGGTHLYMVGETAVGEFDAIDYGCGQAYGNGYDWIDAYVGPHALDGQFDFPSSHRMEYGLVTGTMGYVALEGVVHDMETRYRPEGLHVRFLGTHDTNRIASQVAFDPAADCRWPGGSACGALPATSTDPAVFDRIARAFTALYAMPGIPFLYYGDEIAMPGGNDPDNRRDMVWEGALASVAMGGSTTLSAEQRDLHDHIAAVARARLGSAAMRRGRRVPLVVEDDLYVVAWTSEADDEVAVVALRRGAAITDQPIDGLVSTIRGSATTLERVAGSGTATLGTGLNASRFLLTLPAEGSAIFVGRP